MSTSLSDPIYEPIRKLYGVDDKDAYIEEAKKYPKRKEAQENECVVCHKGPGLDSEKSKCCTPGYEHVGCNCCSDCRNNCPLK